MITHALNSGAINAVPFPGAEEGASVIDLLGTVEVTGSLSAISLRLTATARTSPSAVCSVNNVKSRMQLQATTAPSAVATNTDVQSRITLAGNTSGECSTAAAIVVKFNTSALTEAAAQVSVSSYQYAARSASATASATATANCVKYFYRGAETTGSASVSVPDARIKLTPGVASAQPSVIPTVGIILAHQLAATSSPTAVASADAARVMSFAASATPSASASAGVQLRVATAIAVQPSANGSAGTTMRYGLFAQEQARAIAADTTLQLNILLGAGTSAQAVASAAGADFASKLPAPFERQIVVPPYDRTMKVVV